MNKLFKIWLYALGSFYDKKTQPYDRQVLIIRSFWILLHIVTCVMIIIGNGRLLDWWQFEKKHSRCSQHATSSGVKNLNKGKI